MRPNGLNRGWLAVVVSLSIVTTWPTSGLAQVPKATGRLGTLPGADGNEERPPTDPLNDQVRLLERSIDQAIDDLQHGDLKRFVRSYQQMVGAYIQVADQLGEASESMGQAAAQLDVTRESLRVAKLDHDGGATDGEQATDVAKLREYLHAKLAASRARLNAASEKDRLALLDEIQALVERLEQLDELGRAVATSGKPLLPGLAASDLERRLDETRQALDEEERLLGVVSESSRRMVTATSRELRRTMRFLEIDARMPRDQVDRLQELRGSMQQTVRQIESTRDDARRHAMNLLLGASSTRKRVPADELLQRADKLLNNVPKLATAPATAAPAVTVPAVGAGKE